jgi:hypothetical protein
MPTTNFYFNNYENSMEQRLVEDLIIESIKIYGMEVFYMPRTLVAKDNLFGEDVLSKFEDAYPVEMYIKSVDGFSGDGDFLSKFGLEIRDEMVLSVSQRRFTEEIADTLTTEDAGRPVEGDLIYFPLNGKVFEVKFVEHEAVFYQMGSLQTYDLTLELFEYSHEQFNTDIDVIDSIETAYSGDSGFYQLTDESGNILTMQDGSRIVQENFRIEDTDASANNEYYTTQTQSGSSLNFIDWSESNPFGDF